MAQSVVTDPVCSRANPTELELVLVLPGSTELDSQGRIQGSLDVPLNPAGNRQAEQFARELRNKSLDVIYCSPCLSARQTAGVIAGDQTRVRVQEDLKNLDRGLWHGKQRKELQHSQPRLYRQWKEQPETVCPPGGETIDQARKRVVRVLERILRKHKRGTIGLVVPEPAASVVRQQLLGGESLGDLWQAESRHGIWESIAPQSRPA